MASGRATASAVVRTRARSVCRGPAVVATQRLAYRLLAAAWRIESATADGGNVALAGELFGKDGASRLHDALAGIVNAMRNGTTPPDADVPPFVAAEVMLLRNSIVTTSPRA